MRLGRTIVVILGAAGALLGALWLLQGLGLVHLRPILCVANCQELRGPSLPWAIAGGVVLLIGLTALALALAFKPGAGRSK